MKFLIVDDNRQIAEMVAEIIQDLGEVDICSKVGDNLMPSKEDVISAISQADFILLDGQLCSEYGGKDLVSYCEGKKVLGISSSMGIARINWYDKDDLSPRDQNKRKIAIESLLNAVSQVI